MELCHDDLGGKHLDQLYWTSLFLIIYGYLYMLFALFLCCFGIGFALIYRSWSVFTVEEEEDLEKSEDTKHRS
jgi:hypothetical protein